MDKNIIIKLLEELDVASLSDALDSLGLNGGLEGIKPQSVNKSICGRAFTVKYGLPSEEDKIVAKAANFIDNVKSNEVVVLANNGREDCTIWGGILTNVAVKNNIAGTIIDGMCRDIREINELSYPLYSKGVYMKTGKGRAKKLMTQTEVYIGNTKILPGDYIRADENGVIVIPQDKVEEVLKRAKNIKNTESLILEAVLNGMKLESAREKYKYNRPWEDK